MKRRSILGLLGIVLGMYLCSFPVSAKEKPDKPTITNVSHETCDISVNFIKEGDFLVPGKEYAEAGYGIQLVERMCYRDGYLVRSQAWIKLINLRANWRRTELTKKFLNQVYLS